MQNEKEKAKTVTKDVVQEKPVRKAYISGTANVRAEASASANVIGLLRNEVVELLSDEKNSFYHVKSGKIDGYVHAIYVQEK